MKICYTTIFGGYDRLRDPKVSDEWKYYCITDKPVKSKVWDNIIIKDYNITPVRMARLYKILGHTFFNEIYQNVTTVYIDGAVQIKRDLNNWINNNDGNIVMMRHPARSTIKQELHACISMKKDNPEIMKKQVDSYYRQGYEDKYLTQSTIILRRGNVRKAMELWWSQILLYSYRDQLSFGYAMWKANQDYKVIDWDTKNFIWHKYHK